MLQKCRIVGFYLNLKTLTVVKILIPVCAACRYVYIYDKRGVEVHCLKEHTEPHVLQFLPHHLLLTSVGEPGACCPVLPRAARAAPVLSDAGPIAVHCPTQENKLKKIQD